MNICDILDLFITKIKYKPHRHLTKFVKDRPGHDRRYAIDPTKIERNLDWKPKESFESGLEKTVRSYLDNKNWCENIRRRGYKSERLGVFA